MSALETFRATVRVAKYIESNLETLARIVEGTESRNVVFNSVTVDLKKLFPQDDADALAQALITEQCRVEFIKLKDAQKVTSYTR